MATEPQIAANRRNSKKSTGPKSPEGKLTVSKNAVRHGLLANNGLLPDEDPEEFARFFAEIFESLDPAGASEESLVERIIWLTWRLGRARRAEAGRYIWNRYPAVRVKVFDFDDKEYRAAVEDAVRAQYRPTNPDATPEEQIAADASIGAIATRTIESGYYAQAWSPEFHLSLSKYESRLERQRQKLLAQLDKLQTARKKSSGEKPNSGAP